MSMTRCKMSFNLNKLKGIQQAIAYEFVKSLAQIEAITKNKLEDATPVMSGKTKSGWRVDTDKSKFKRVGGRSKATLLQKNNVMEVKLRIRNPSRAVKFLRQTYTQKGEQVLIGRLVPRTDPQSPPTYKHSLQVISAFPLNHSKSSAVDARGTHRRKYSMKNRKRARRKRGLGRVISVVTGRKSIKPFSKLSLENGYEKKLERILSKAIGQIIRRTDYFVGTWNVEFVYANTGRE